MEQLPLQQPNLDLQWELIFVAFFEQIYKIKSFVYIKISLKHSSLHERMRFGYEVACIF